MEWTLRLGSRCACLSLPVVDADGGSLLTGKAGFPVGAPLWKVLRCWATGCPPPELCFVWGGRGWPRRVRIGTPPILQLGNPRQAIGAIPLQAANLGAPSPNPCPDLPLTTELAIDRPFSRRFEYLGSSPVVNWACFDVCLGGCRRSGSSAFSAIVFSSWALSSLGLPPRLLSRHSRLSLIVGSPTQPCRLQSAAAGQTTSRSTRMAPQQKTRR